MKDESKAVTSVGRYRCRGVRSRCVITWLSVAERNYEGKFSILLNSLFLSEK